MPGEDPFPCMERLMGRRKSTGYVAAKIRANTARRLSRVRRNPDDLELRDQLVALAMAGPDGIAQVREIAGVLDVPLTDGGWPLNMSGVDLSGADLSEADLSGAFLHGADLSGANLIEARLSRANLSNANLSNAKLRYVDLIEARLRDANLSNANLTSAALWGANLRGANLYGANLSGADFKGANLKGANLYGAKLRDVYTSWMKYDSSTLWPRGFTPPPMSR